MKKKCKHSPARIIVSTLLIILLVAGTLPLGGVDEAYASMRGGSFNQDALKQWLKGEVSQEEEEFIEPEAPVEATNDKDLPSDSTQEAQTDQLGLPTEQPARFAPSGKEVDKSKNPLGPSLLVTNRVLQLAYSTGTGQVLHPKPIGSDKANLTLASAIGANGDLSFTGNTAAAALDINGDGKLEMVTAGIKSRLETPRGSKIPVTKYDLVLFVTDYNNISTGIQPTYSKTHTVASDIKFPGTTGITNESLRITTGDFNRDGIDEIALAASKQVYICKADMNSIQIISKREFEGERLSDIEAGDADGDGFLELMVALKLQQKSQLLIYNTADLSKPVHTADLEYIKNNKQQKIIDVGIDVGDVFGDGAKRIIISGSAGGGAGYSGAALSYIGFDPVTETYDSSLKGAYELESSDADLRKAKAAVQNMTYDVKCAALVTPAPGVPESVIINGVILQYDAATDKFIRQQISSWTEDSNDVSVNSADKCKGNITNANWEKDQTWIIDTLVGNFDGNKNGKEQVLILHYNKWYSKEIAYVTQCYATEPTASTGSEIKANLREVFRLSDKNPYTYPRICAIDTKNTGITLEFHPERSSFAFSNPIITAVLAASPFYEELGDKYQQLDQASTKYGTSAGSSESDSNGIKASVGVSLTFEQGLSVLGVQIAKIEMENEIKNSFAYSWESSKSIEKSVSYTNMYTDNAVVLTIIPTDIYFYTAYYLDEDGNKHSEEMMMQVPYSPITTIRPLPWYNEVAAKIPNAPVIGPEVLGNLTIGDPRTYPDGTKKLSNISDKGDVLTVGKDLNSSLSTCGIGNSSTEQGITTSSTTGKNFDYELSYSTSFNVAAFGVGVGASLEAGFTHSYSVSTSESTTRSGSVYSVPLDCGQYEFQWALAAYNYDLKAGDSTQRCAVINYYTKPIGKYPPKPPKNFSMDSRDLTSNTLKWEASPDAAGYTISRSENENGTSPTTFNVSGASTVTYKDASPEKDKTYYYTIASISGTKNSVVSVPLKVDHVSVTGMSIKTQPKLTYNEGDPLDLSALAVSLSLSSGDPMDIAFSGFSDAGITTSLADKAVLEPANTGSPIEVKLSSYGKSANTGNLTVNAKSPYDFSINVNFKIGAKDNVTALEAGKTLQAVTELTNTTSSSQDVLIIFALYTDKGNMEKVDYVTKKIAPSAKETVTQSIALPANISGYKAKVFVWDGTAMNATTLSPKALSRRIPSL